MLNPQPSAKPARREYLLLILALLASLGALWQWVLFAEDNSFLDGICSALDTRALAPEARAVRVYSWTSAYDDHLPPSESAAPPGPLELLTLRSIVEHRAYFQSDCGPKAWLMAALAERAGLSARELRLCDAAHVTHHVVCEVRIGRRWVVFDPTIGVDFRRRDGRLATAAELKNPALLAANTARAPQYRAQHWRFDHAERLHFEKLPLLGGLIRRLVPRLTGHPAEELALPAALQRPRLLTAGVFAALALLALAATGGSALRRRQTTARTVGKARLMRRALAAEGEQD